MIAKDIIKAIDASPLAIWNEHLLNKDYPSAFASDLMSDALALIQNSPDSTVLITGLCNAQVLRTAEMLDVEMIIFVRNKRLSDEDLEQVWGGSKIPYIVRMNDTLGDLAPKFNCSVEDVCRWNNIQNPNQIWEGQLLIFKF